MRFFLGFPLKNKSYMSLVIQKRAARRGAPSQARRQNLKPETVVARAVEQEQVSYVEASSGVEARED